MSFFSSLEWSSYPGLTLVCFRTEASCQVTNYSQFTFFFAVIELPSRRSLAKILDVPAEVDVMNVSRQCGLTKSELNGVEASAAGGGQPAASFFETVVIEKASEPIKDLRMFFKDSKMIKAYDILKRYKDNAVLDDIKPIDLNKLAEVTTLSTKAVAFSNNWETVAEFYQMQAKIPLFKSTIKSNHCYSPTECMLRTLDVTYCNKINNIGVFLKHVSEAGHKQAVEEINRQIKKLAKTMLSGKYER